MFVLKELKKKGGRRDPLMLLLLAASTEFFPTDHYLVFWVG